MTLSVCLALAALAVAVWNNIGNPPSCDWRELRNRKLSAKLDADLAAYKVRYGRLPV